MELNIPWTPVKALLNLAAKADIREWCNGVWIDLKGPTLAVMATTGVILGVYRTEEPSTDGPDVFLPRHVIEACARDFSVSATVRRESDGRMAISSPGTTHYWQDKGFTAVDWRRVIPRGNADGRARQFDATLLAPFVKTRHALGGRKDSVAGAVLIAHTTPPRDGVDGLLVTLLDHPNFVGVLTPLRDDAAVKGHLRVTAPDWVREVGRSPVPATANDLV